MTDSGTPSPSAISVPLSTRRSAPIAMSAAPMIRSITFFIMGELCSVSFLVSGCGEESTDRTDSIIYSAKIPISPSPTPLLK